VVDYLYSASGSEKYSAEYAPGDVRVHVQRHRRFGVAEHALYRREGSFKLSGLLLKPISGPAGA
jgi:hypothetical protein